MTPARLYFMCIFLCIALSGAACSQSSTAEPVRRTQFIMGTLVEITIVNADAKVAQTAANQAFDEMSRIEKLMSTYIADSEISRINEAAGKEALPVSAEVLEIIQSGIAWGEKTKGIFDISIHPLVETWDFDGGGETVPSPEQLKTATGLVNFRDIRIQGNTVRLAREGMAINLGGIAKGYAVDRAITILKGLVPNGIINAGGDLYAFGQRGPDRPWVIGLQHPRKPQGVLASFALANQGVATSGDYQRYFMKGEKRYHHILDPATGLPAEGPISVTVMAPTVMDADALSTAVFIMGKEKGIEWIESMDNVEVMVIDETGAAHFSSGFNKLPQFAMNAF
ncbi:thiamine biosynthesis lipoprotein [Nitrospina gracilis]|uniref:FAD:protein FMN transferase n=1 Tax=Nitrospina sp. Nb-3 TaxID=2940485 RepID=UPI001F45D13B|nr:FAD:protein FMN transferase [Nitrospina sp. Nb-3]MCF8724028.1 thiamine biosynthesis lipoprotein [Nitrospina sp. Nb-3]